MSFLNVRCQECGNFTMNHRCMFVKEDGLLLFGGQRICGIAVCALCSVKFGSEEGIFRCAEHGPSVTDSSVPAKKPPRPPGVASRNVKRKNMVPIERRSSPRTGKKKRKLSWSATRIPC